MTIVVGEGMGRTSRVLSVTVVVTEGMGIAGFVSDNSC